MRRRASLLVSIAVLASAGTAMADEKKECIDAFDKGQALRNDHKLTSSRQQLLLCAREVCPAMVRKDCGDLLLQVESATPSIVISAKGADGRDVLDVKVTSDGATLTTSLDGRAIAMDPGPHALRFEMPGAPPVEQQLLVREGDKNRDVSVVFRAGPAAPPQVVPPPPPTSVAQQPTPPPAAPPTNEAPPAGGSSSLKWIGLSVAGAGVIGLGVGAIFGLQASSKWSDAQDQCRTNGATGCLAGSPAYALRDDAQSAATISTIAFIAGGILVAGGATLFLLAPSSKSTAMVRVAPTIGGLQVDGHF